MRSIWRWLGVNSPQLRAIAAIVAIVGGIYVFVRLMVAFVQPDLEAHVRFNQFEESGTSSGMTECVPGSARVDVVTVDLVNRSDRTLAAVQVIIAGVSEVQALAADTSFFTDAQRKQMNGRLPTEPRPDTRLVLPPFPDMPSGSMARVGFQGRIPGVSDATITVRNPVQVTASDATVDIVPIVSVPKTGLVAIALSRARLVLLVASLLLGIVAILAVYTLALGAAKPAFMVGRARVAVNQGRTHDAVCLLSEAVRAGYTGYGRLKLDPDFEPIREMKQFKELAGIRQDASD
jgi:hypothetical protein